MLHASAPAHCVKHCWTLCSAHTGNGFGGLHEQAAAILAGLALLWSFTHTVKYIAAHLCQQLNIAAFSKGIIGLI